MRTGFLSREVDWSRFPPGLKMNRHCELHGVWECTRCMSPDEYYRWRVQHDMTLSIGWGRFYEVRKSASP